MTFDALPVHAFTGLTAIGLLPSGRPVWPVMGGAPDDGEQAGDGQETADDAAGDGDAAQADDAGDVETDDKPLGEKGEKALAAEKDKRKAEAAKRRAAEKRATELEAELAKARKGQKAEPAKDDDSAQAVDPEEIRREAREQARVEAARERVLDKIEVAAAKTFADPADAAALLLRGKEIEDFLDDGKPDVEAIQDALTALLKNKPYLGATAQGGKRFQGTVDAGAKPVTPQRSRSLTEAVTRALTPK